MAMIECPKCGRHISSMARTCPECGAPVELEDEAPLEPENIETEDLESDDEEVVVDEPVVEDAVETETPEPVAQKTEKHKKGAGALKFLLWALFLALLIGGLYLYDFVQQYQREQHAYELLQDCSTPDRYEDFIARFPKSSHIDDVRERLKVVAKQQEEWAKLIVSGTRKELKKFVVEHPTSPYVKVAQSRIDSLDWAEASEANTLEAVTEYVTTHPDGYFLDEAETLRQALERKEAEAAAAAAATRRDSVARADSTVVLPTV